jgi:hypothetical protein
MPLWWRLACIYWRACVDSFLQHVPVIFGALGAGKMIKERCVAESTSIDRIWVAVRLCNRAFHVHVWL